MFADLGKHEEVAKMVVSAGAGVIRYVVGSLVFERHRRYTEWNSIFSTTFGKNQTFKTKNIT